MLALLGVAPFLPLRRTQSRSAPAEDFEQLLRLANVPSMNVALVDGDRVTTRSFGVRATGSSEAVTENSVYSAASLTKSVFSYVFLGLVDEGVVALDKPVGDYVALPNPADPRAGSITPRRLLSHSSGWRNWRNNATTPLTADFEPGTRWSYSGEGFFHLQRIIEHVTGKSLAELARARVFEPLGMTHSSMIASTELEAIQVPGHDARGGAAMVFGRPTLLELRRAMMAKGVSLETARVEDSEQAIRSAEPTLPVLPNFLVPNAAASMVTTSADFGRFLSHVVTAKHKGGQPARIVDMMMTPQIRCNEAVQWGLGVGLDDVGGARYAWQWGDNPGYKNIYFADVANGKAIAIFTNGDHGSRVYERAVRELTGVDHPAFLWI